ncbi:MULTISPECIES: aspartate aminotransferase family protein [Rhizobium/Agrobacterium group]|jgi:acetylornithine/N-succinyldiaminopimelate aminotransferase|uniref:Acetylornithine aminotransferase n=2 Tax=Rhizobium/Agrobacterium group TaxID=227290 RepID=A0A546XI37_RHIRH|nr:MULTISPECIES: aspartate aminotransferase family protein [Rhizobium/Agrobacterium group]MCZ7470306.1 aspartate aminotransferase family protein [Rhizobium rhizogenes]MCZ7479611.1 aspartate aminotransferase family protein [Rhizobium rhizogenes]MDA5631845.1 aspartate aminotransferase family protein [Agrobacterium sp. ST15.16.024]MDF1887708.1 aspartate aminotransferase family protein [Rhizobium rhizogenes]TRB00423.1 aspartate aminotransferase family protein [Rhizobium rhizogenes]
MAEAAAPLFDTFSRAPLRFERGEGVWLFTESGERYLDFAAGVAVNSLGHAHPHLVEAIKTQAEKVWHVSNLYEVPGQEKLAKRLTEATFADKVFFTNSGAEALECAIKTARRYHYSKGHPEKFRIVTFEGAFHGRTLATIAAGGQQKYLEGFGPKVEGFDQVPFADVDALKAAITAETAALLIEPIQGEGGIRAPSKEFLQILRGLCDEHGLLLIFDEVQTGVGRTGKLFAYEQTGVAPDIMAVAKGIGGGFPLGACLATADAASGMTAGVHGTTYGGNPLAMAVGNAVLDVVLADGFLEKVRDVALVFRQGLASLKDRYPDVIEEIRGEGLLMGIKAKVPSGDLLQAMRAEHLLGVPAGDNVIRLLPPLVTTAEEAREGLARVEAAAASLTAKQAKIA